MTTTTLMTSQPAMGRIRPLNVLRDLPAVADLIELCFSSTLDADGRSYIDQMRRNGRDSNFLNWAPRVIETVSLPLSGFVWENKGRVVGNVSLIPFSKQGQKTFLIANVATHPDHRRQGIARELTASALNRAREKHAQAVWLHVRDDNHAAKQLYNELGFVERTRRTAWRVSPGTIQKDSELEGVEFTPRAARDWPIQKKWLSRAYPTDLDWYFPQTWNLFKPGLINALYLFMLDVSVQQWSAYRNEKLQGVLGCQRSNGRSDQLWAALPTEFDPEVITALLHHSLRALVHSRNVMFEYPTGDVDEVIRAAGFVFQRTLAWMEAPGETTF